MLLKEAIEYICKNKGAFIVKSFIRNHKKFTEQDLKGEKKYKYFCKGHNKCHKYTFHAYIELFPGTAFMLGVDTAKEVIEYANDLKLRIETKK